MDPDKFGKLLGLVVLGVIALRYLIVPMLADTSCATIGPGCDTAAKLWGRGAISGNQGNQIARSRAGFAHANAWTPIVDCAAMGGQRTVNPNTGNPSCFVPNR